MKVVRQSLIKGAEEAQGITVVIDVLRAFTCSAIMFKLGLKELYLVKDADRALEIRASFLNALAVGEVEGRKYPGYDFGNSPTELWQAGRETFENRTAIMRTSAGTQGVVTASQNASVMILGSFVTAQTIAKFIKQHPDNDVVTIVAMGLGGQANSIEDESCAEYIESLLTDKPYDHMNTIWNCMTDSSIAKTLRGERPHMPREDVLIALQRDIFDFVMVAEATHDDAIVVRKVAI